MRINIEAIKNKAKERPEGYVEDVLSQGVVVGNFLEIEALKYKKLLDKYAPNTPMPAAKCCNQMPPVATQLKNAANAAGRVVGALVRGEGVLAPQDEVERRKGICGGCQFLNGNRCSKCGCFYSRKVQLLTEKCPIGLW